MLTIGSLFSGIGGLELGLEQAGLGPTLWQVERDRFCRCVLAHHWPDAERFDDVCKFARAEPRPTPVDLVCGGFPCQDVSSAGLRAGLAGERSGLWREFARVVGTLRPRWVVVENVQSGAGRWLDAVVRELEELGYDALPLPVSARDVGAPHIRQRLFIVANAHGGGELQPQGSEPKQRGRAADGALANSVREHSAGQPRRRGSERTVSAEPGGAGASRGATDADEQLGDARPSDTREERAGRAEPRGVAPDAHNPRRERPGPGAQVARRQGLAPHPGWPSEPGMVPLVHGLSGGMVGRRRRARIRALGNSVVPQCAEVVGWVIRELLEREQRT